MRARADGGERVNLQQIAQDLNRVLDEQVPEQGHGLDQKAMCIAEEAGELVGAYRRWSGQARRAGTKQELAAEVADLIICTSSFAERAGIDISEAVSAKLEKIYSRGWKQLWDGVLRMSTASRRNSAWKSSVSSSGSLTATPST